MESCWSSGIIISMRCLLYTSLGVSELLRDIIEQTGYVTELEAEDTEEAKARIENIDELISKAAAYEAVSYTHLDVYKRQV